MECASNHRGWRNGRPSYRRSSLDDLRADELAASDHRPHPRQYRIYSRLKRIRELSRALNVIRYFRGTSRQHLHAYLGVSAPLDYGLSLWADPPMTNGRLYGRVRTW